MGRDDLGRKQPGPGRGPSEDPLLPGESAAATPNAFAATDASPGRGRTGMVATDFEAERGFDDDRFRAHVFHESDAQKVVMGYFRPGQFIPVHAPESDVAVTVLTGEGIVRDGETDHRVEPGSVVVVPAGTDRGVRADTELQATLVASPPPGDTAHEPVRRGLERDEFEPA